MCKTLHHSIKQQQIKTQRKWNLYANRINLMIANGHILHIKRPHTRSILGVDNAKSKRKTKPNKRNLHYANNNYNICQTSLTYKKGNGSPLNNGDSWMECSITFWWLISEFEVYVSSFSEYANNDTMLACLLASEHYN